MNSEIPEIDESEYSKLQVYLESDSCGNYSYLYKYKKKTSLLTQQERREAFLREQKEKRHTVADKNRKQFELFCEKPREEPEECPNDAEEPMDYEMVQTAHKERKKKVLDIRLMQSEWFTEIPDNLEDDWIVKFVPVGHRVIVIATNRTTTIYNCKGKPFLHIQSNFPGGGKIGNKGPTILDCILNKKTNTIFILDCLCWNKMCMLDLEARYRFLWLNSKYSDQPDLAKCRKYRFINLREIPAEKSLIQDRMLQTFRIENDNYFYDGVAFYHKEGHYTLGFTPLLGWLAPFMLSEMLHIDVAFEHMVKKPKNYMGIHDYLQKLSLKKRVHRRKSVTRDEEMDSEMDNSSELVETVI